LVRFIPQTLEVKRQRVTQLCQPARSGKKVPQNWPLCMRAEN
jgi:hypothetical protein